MADESVAPWLHVTDCTSHEIVSLGAKGGQRALAACLGQRQHPLAGQCSSSRSGRGAGAGMAAGLDVETREAYFWAASTGLPACLRAPSGPRAEVLILSCARTAEEVEDAGLTGPLTWEPLKDVAAAVLDMSVPVGVPEEGACRSGTGGSSEAQDGAKSPMQRRGLRQGQRGRMRARRWTQSEGRGGCEVDRGWWRVERVR